MKKAFLLSLLSLIVVFTSCSRGIANQQEEQKQEQQSKPIATKVLTVVAVSQINYSEGSAEFSVVFDNGDCIIKRVSMLSKEGVNSIAFVKENHVCKVGYDEKGKPYVIENQTIKERMNK